MQQNPFDLGNQQEDQGYIAEFKMDEVYFTPSTFKLVSLTLLTSGMYMLYWLYKNFSLMKQRHNNDSWPIIRTMMATFFVFAIFRDIVNFARENNIKSEYSYWSLYILFFIALMVDFSMINSENIVLCCLAHSILIPIYYANNLGMRINKQLVKNYQLNDSITPANLIFILLGVLIIWNQLQELEQLHQEGVDSLYENIRGYEERSGDTKYI